MRQSNTDATEILSLGIPSVYASSVLLNALAAHEIGHLLHSNRESAIDAIVTDAYEREWNRHKDDLIYYATDKALDSTSGSFVDPDTYAAKVQELRDATDYLARNWCREVYSDLLAVHLLGPAFIAALDRVSLGNEALDYEHPAMEFRRNLLTGHIRQHFSHLDFDGRWSALGTTAAPSRVVNRIERFGESVCVSAAAALAESLRDIPSALTADSATLETAISAMHDHIMHMSPPSVALEDMGLWLSETGFWTLIYAVWLFRVDDARFTQFKTYYNWDDDSAEDHLGNLLLQSLKSLQLYVCRLNDGHAA